MRKTTSKVLAVLLVIAMCISLMPSFVFAAADDVTYTKASSIEAGKEYLFVGKSGSGEKYYALANNDNSTTTDGNGQKQTVTVSNNSITVSASKAESISWKAAASGSGFAFTCGGKNLSTGSNNRIAMGSSATVLTASGVTLRSGNLTLCYGNNSAASTTYMFFLGNPGSNITAVDVYVREGSGSTDPVTPSTGTVYSLTNKFEIGKTYLIVSVNNGSGVALANNSSSSSSNGFSTVAVTVSGNQINASNLSKAEWQAKSTGTGTDLIGLYNGNNVLKVDASSTSSPYIKTGDTSYNAGGFGYTANNHVSYPYGTNPRDYYIGSNGSSSFKASNTESNLGSVYIFVKGEGGSTDPVTPTDPPVTPSGDAVYLGFTSDAHNKTSNTSANRLSNWLSNVSAKLGNVTFADFGTCGDMGDAGASGNTFWSDAQAVIDVVRNSRLVAGNGFFVAGNHEWQNGSFGSTNNATKSYYYENGEKLVTADYILYSFGAASGSDKYESSDITALGNYLKTAPTDRPIFILSHFPLHSSGGRSTQNAASMISTLNEYADDHTIIFLWGHNHTVSDSHYDTVYTGSLDGQSIAFTYCAAGCMSDSEYGTGSASVKGKGLVAAIDNGSVTFTYYTENASVVGTPKTVKIGGGGVVPVDPVDPTPSGTTISFTPSTENPTQSAKIGVGESITVKLTNGSSNSSYTFSTSFGTSGVASASPSSLNLAMGASGEIVITGLKAGTTTVTFANNNSYSSQYQRKATLNLTVGEGGSTDPVTPSTGTVYSLTNKFEIGKTYLIVSVNNGSGVALANNSSTSSSNGFSTVAVTVSGNQINASNLSKAEWEAKSTGTGTNLIGLYNGSNVLKVDASNTNSPYIKTGDTSYNAGGFGYTANNHVSYPYGTNPQDYYIGSNGSSSFKASNTESNLGSVYIFVKGEGGSTDPVTPPTPSGTTVSFTPSTENPTQSAKIGVGDTLTVKLTNGSSNSSYTFSTSFSTSGVASASPSSLNLAMGASGEIVITGLKEGTTTVTFANENSYGSQYQRKATLNLTVGEGGSTDPVTPPTPTGDETFVAFSSDVHNGTGNVSSANRLQNWINYVTGKVGGSFDRMGFCGDMGPASGSQSAYFQNAQQVMDVVENSAKVLNGGFYICGNHEYSPGNYTHNYNSTTQKYSDAGTYVIADNYIFYSLGARQGSEQYSDADINALSSFLASHADFEGPIFILAHYPLHSYSGWSWGGSSSGGESSTIHDGNPAIGSAKIINVLNDYSNAIFVWGHNHSSSNDHYDQVYTDKINDTEINFTYCAAGCMSDSEYGSSGNVKGKGLVAAIGTEGVTLTYYDANGNVVGTPAFIEIGSSAPAVTYTITATAGANGSISPSGAVKVGEGRSKTFTFTPNAGYEVDTVTVNGSKVSVSGNSYTVSNVRANTTINVTFKAVSGSSYAPASKAENGGKYLLVSNGYALFNNNGRMSAVPVTVSGNSVIISDSNLEGATWTFEAVTGSNKSGDFTVVNNGYYFSRVSDASGNAQAAEITKSLKTSGESGLPYYQWSYNASSGQLSQIGGQDQSATFYAYYDASGSAFYTASEAQGLKLYVIANAPHVHTAAAAVRENEVAATCKTEGSYDSVVYCSVCGDEMSRTHMTIDKLPHTPVTDAAVAPTCTETGLTEGSHCSVCGEVLKAQEVIPAKGHTPGEPIKANEVEATCHATGSYTELVICTVCNTLISDKLVVTPKLEHVPVADAGKDPTCTATGLTEGSHCSLCGETLVAQEVIPAKGHTPGEPKAENVVDATCTVPGAYDEVVRCVDCNVIISTTHITGKLLPHTVVVDAAVEATCTETGLTEGSHCSVCGEVLEAQVIIPAKGHTHVVDAAVEATCTETGLTEGSHCSVCGEVFVAQVVVPAKGHTVVADAAVEATCTETGLTEGSHCSVCGEILVAQEVVPAKGHTVVVDAAVEATCTETGLTEGSHCSVCGEVLKAQEVVPAKGHSFKDGKCTECGADDPDYKPVVENPFIDVSESAVYYDAILWAADSGITSGYGNGEFRPQISCSRGQVVTFLWRAAGSPEPKSSNNPFVDVQNSGNCAPYYKAILWAYENGITTGVDETHFKPYDTVTRAQFVTFLWRYEGKPATTGSIDGFKDASKIAAPFREAVAWAVEKGITTGYEDGTFRPNDPCTRWAVVLFMYRDLAK